MIWHIYKYIFLLNTLCSVKSCLVAPGVAEPPWATETVLSPWLTADEDRVSHVLSHVVWWIYIYMDANFIKHNRHFMFTYFLLDPFEFPYYFYRIWGELIYALSIVVCIPSTFCPTLGHHQGRIYYKSDVTFILAYYYCVRASLPLKIMSFAFKWNSIISASS